MHALFSPSYYNTGHRSLALVYLLCHKVYKMFQKTLISNLRIETCNLRLLKTFDKHSKTPVSVLQNRYWSLFAFNLNNFDQIQDQQKS